MMPWDRSWQDEEPQAKEPLPCRFCGGYGTVLIGRRGMCDPDVTEIACEDCDGTGESYE